MQATAPSEPPEAGVIDFWSRELLFCMDWKLLHEITIRMVAGSGYRVKKEKLGPTGEGLYGIFSGSSEKPQVYLSFARWRCSHVPLEEIKLLYSRLRSHGVSRGVFVTAGEFAPAAYEFAVERHLELIGGAQLLETIRRMSIHDRDRLLHLITLGEFTHPSCPSCESKMILREVAASESDGRHEDVCFRESARIDRDARFRHLVIEPGAEIVFEKFVRAETMDICGSVTGELVCEGAVDIHDGAHVRGSVSARAINLLPGGILDGEMKILTGEKGDSGLARENGPIWICRRFPACKAEMNAA